MRQFCAVPYCVAETIGKGKAGKRHGFPKEPQRLRAWMKFCGKNELSKADVVCGKHFRDEDYVASSRILGHPISDWRLTKCAVPTLNGPDPAERPDLEAVPETVEIQAENDDMDMIVEEDDEIIIEENVEEEDDRLPVTSKCRLCLCIPEASDAGSLFDKTEQQGAISCDLRHFFQLQVRIDSFVR